MYNFHYLVTVDIIDQGSIGFSERVILPVSLEEDDPTRAIKEAALLVKDYECKPNYSVQLVARGLKMKAQFLQNKTSADEVKGLLK